MSTPFDFEPAYKAAGPGGVAWRVTRHVKEQIAHPVYDEDGEYTGWDDWDEEEDESRVVAHMIGDDVDWTFDVTDLTPLDDEEFCRDCGQIGCGHNVYS
jgi:hypothetical protein